ncbi:aspartate-semialdehyde dehydrogenase [Dehalococcoidia bacterium]|nr:aspartate-semialdehyde dehydrogenase [Dehalococcoidia bacterium]
MRNVNLAIVGATGLVGGEFLRILETWSTPIGSIRLYASDRSAGKRLSFRGSELQVEETIDSSFDGIDIALFSAGADVSQRFSPAAVQAGAVVVDNSSAFRMEPQVPLVVPEVNPDDLKHHQGIIANPNCSTIQMVVALNPLHKANPIKRIVVSTYQAVAGTGLAAVDELNKQIRQVMKGQDTSPSVYPHQIAFNVIPFVDDFLDNGYTVEEWKMVTETRKIMHIPDLPVSATCVRVPVYLSHSEAVNVEFTNPMTPQEARDILHGAPGVEVTDDPSNHKYPMPLTATGRDEVLVGRIREGLFHPNSLAMWIVADDLRKGAALNAIQLAEEILNQNLLLTDQ